MGGAVVGADCPRPRPAVPAVQDVVVVVADRIAGQTVDQDFAAPESVVAVPRDWTEVVPPDHFPTHPQVDPQVVPVV